VVEITNAIDGGNQTEKKFHITSSPPTWQTYGQMDMAKTALTRSVSRLEPHQIVSMCCCTASI